MSDTDNTKSQMQGSDLLLGTYSLWTQLGRKHTQRQAEFFADYLASLLKVLYGYEEVNIFGYPDGACGECRLDIN